MNTSPAALITNIVFLVQGGLFTLLMSRILGLYLPNALFFSIGAALGLMGVIQVLLAAMSGETGTRKWFFVITGVSAAGIALSAILHNLLGAMGSFILGAFFFLLGLVVFPLLFVGSWFGSLVLLGTAGKPVSRQRRRTAGLVAALAAGATACAIGLNVDGEGYSVTSELMRMPDRPIERIFVLADVDEFLAGTFDHSFRHSLVSAFESNGIEATIEPSSKAGGLPGDSLDPAAPDADALIYISVRPLYRMHTDGYQAIVGTVFEATLVDAATGEDGWRLSGTVDYIADQFFKQHGFRAHEGIRKEYAWHTTAAIVRTFMADVAGRESAPIYTVTEERQRRGQRTD